MGEGIFVILEYSLLRRRGGRSRDLVGWGKGASARAKARVVQGFGLPGSASHRKGTEAWVW